MRLITRCLFTLLVASSICRGSNWYASSSGSGNGTLASPWSLETAIANSSVKPGDTIWLLGGTYVPTTTYPDQNVTRVGWVPTINGSSSGEITLASYSNQWAAIDRPWMFKSPGASYLCFSNLEFYDSLKGNNLTNSGNPPLGSVPWNHFCMGTLPGFQWVNCLIHDVDNCFSSGSCANSVRGNVMWYVGWNALEHVCYPAPASLTGNICGWHCQNLVNFNTANFTCSSNIIFGGGNTIPSLTSYSMDIAIGGYNETVTGNYIYNRGTSSSGAFGICVNGSTAGTLVINNNVIAAPAPVWFSPSGSYGSTQLENNTIYASSSTYSSQPVANLDPSGGPWTTANNAEYTSPGTEPPYAVYVVPNQDVAQRANIAVYNWPKSNNVTINLSGVLSAGSSYQVISAFNYKAGPIQSGTFNGTSITIPMTNLTAAKILYGTEPNFNGQAIVQPTIPSPSEFGAFVVIGSSSGSGATPVVTWPTPAAITYGTPLSSTQLNATANTQGAFAYSPPSGTVLNKGASTLSVIFTASNGSGSATNNVNLLVSPASLKVVASNASRQYGVANPIFTGAMTGLLNGDNISAAYSCSATLSSAAGTYPIVPSLVDPNDRQTNYTVSLTNGTLTVVMVAPLPGSGLHIVSP